MARHAVPHREPPILSPSSSLSLEKSCIYCMSQGPRPTYEEKAGLAQKQSKLPAPQRLRYKATALQLILGNVFTYSH